MDDLRVNLALLLKHSCSESFRGILIENWNSSLRDDRAMVVIVVGKMDGTATDFRPERKHGFMNVMSIHPLPAKCG